MGNPAPRTLNGLALGDKEIKPTPNLGAAHSYRQSSFPGTLGNYLDAEVRGVEWVENAVDNHPQFYCRRLYVGDRPGCCKVCHPSPMFGVAYVGSSPGV
jgi:hypothetical protein